MNAMRSMPGVLAAALAAVLLAGGSVRAASFAEVVAAVQPKMVKIYGAGGFRGLEAYQSGFLISEEGHILTVWSYVLDTDYVAVVLDDGRRFQAELVGFDPRLEIAVLKIDAVALPHFVLDDAVEVDAAARILAFSNLYGVAMGDEPASVLHGVVSAKTNLTARRGVFETRYQGPVYVLDAMTNNPGAAGGALTDRQGRLVGLLGKELRNTLTNTWLNFAIPAGELSSAVQDILSGRMRPRSEDPDVNRPAEPMTLAQLGITLVPDVLDRTPPFVDSVRSGSPAARAALRADDLVLFVNDRMVQSCKMLVEELSLIDRTDAVRLTVMRDQELIVCEIEP